MAGYKRAALEHNRAGHKEAARGLLLTAKKLEAELAEYDRTGDPRVFRAMVPPPPARCAAAPEPAAEPGAWLGADDGATRHRVFELIGRHLKDEEARCRAASDAAYKAGDVPGALERIQQLEKVQASLASLREAYESGAPAPAYELEEVTTRTPVVLEDVREDRLEVRVERVTGLAPGSGDLFVRVHVEYPTKEEEPTYSPAVRAAGAEAVYGYAVQVPVERRGKSVLMAFEHRKMSVEVHQKRFLRSALPLGRAEVRLAPLLTRCQVDTEAPLLHLETRRPTGAKVHVRLRLRRPLEKEEVAVTVEKRVKLVKVVKVGVGVGVGVGGVEPQSKHEPPKSEPDEPAAPRVALPDPDDLSRMVSNDVLTRELELCEARERQGEDVALRKVMISTSVDLLVMQVQSGALTPEAYMARLKAAIASEKEIVVRLARGGDKEGAKRCLARVKIMEAEVKGWEEREVEEN